MGLVVTPADKSVLEQQGVMEQKKMPVKTYYLKYKHSRQALQGYTVTGDYVASSICSVTDKDFGAYSPTLPE